MGKCFFVCFIIAYVSLGCCSSSILKPSEMVKSALRLSFFFSYFLSVWGHKCTGSS